MSTPERGLMRAFSSYEKAEAFWREIADKEKYSILGIFINDLAILPFGEEDQPYIAWTIQRVHREPT